MAEGAQPTEAQLRELVMRAEQVRQQLASMETQREYLAEITAEARRALTTLEHMSQAKPGDEVLVPLGAGAFVHATLADPTKAIANLGAGLHAELPAADAATRLRTRVEGLDNAQTALGRDIERLSDELARASSILETYYGGA